MSFLVLAVGGCGNNSETPADLSSTAHDMSAAVDMAGGDMKPVTPFNMPGKVYCYNGPLCSTTSATPICCDEGTDGGFSDTCVANAAACSGTDAKTFACGQAADCGAGMVCCGAVGTSSKGKMFIDSTTCATTCGTGLTQLCVTASECKTGTSCVGADVSGRDIGLCQ